MEPNETNETSSILSLEVTQEQKVAIYHFFAHNNWELKEVQIPPNNDQSRDDSGDGDYLLSRMTNLMNVCIVSLNHALQMKEIDSFSGRQIIK